MMKLSPLNLKVLNLMRILIGGSTVLSPTPHNRTSLDSDI